MGWRSRSPNGSPDFSWPRKGVTQIAASSGAFAAMAEGGVVTWGRAGDGGDSSAVESQLMTAGVGAWWSPSAEQKTCCIKSLAAKDYIIYIYDMLI